MKINLFILFFVIIFLTGCATGNGNFPIGTGLGYGGKSSIMVEVNPHDQLEKLCVERVSNWRVRHGMSPVVAVSRTTMATKRILTRSIKNSAMRGLSRVLLRDPNIASSPLLTIGSVFMADKVQRDFSEEQEVKREIRRCKNQLRNKRRYR